MEEYEYHPFDGFCKRDNQRLFPEVETKVMFCRGCATREKIETAGVTEWKCPACGRRHQL